MFQPIVMATLAVGCLGFISACSGGSIPRENSTVNTAELPSAQASTTAVLRSEAESTITKTTEATTVTTLGTPATPVTTPTPTATSQPTQPPITPTAAQTLTPTLTATTATTRALTLVYVFPVRATSVTYGQSHHDYPATDMFCPIGSEFVAPTSGVIEFVSTKDQWDPTTDRPEHRGGLSVAIIGDDGVRYYGSHLSNVAEGIVPGVHVEAGHLLGLTGKSGNARNTPPHLHFGISSPTTPEDWQTRRGQVPPYRYLNAWKRGEQITPTLK